MERNQISLSSSFGLRNCNRVLQMVDVLLFGGLFFCLFVFGVCLLWFCINVKLPIRLSGLMFLGWVLYRYVGRQVSLTICSLRKQMTNGTREEDVIIISFQQQPKNPAILNQKLLLPEGSNISQPCVRSIMTKGFFCYLKHKTRNLFSLLYFFPYIKNCFYLYKISLT